MSDQQVTKIKLSRYNDEAQVMASYAPPGYVIVGFYDARVEPVHPASMTESEWDAFVAAGDRALGRAAPIAPPLADLFEGLANEREAHGKDCWNTDGDGYYGEAEAYREAARMVREAGPTVPRAAVAALRAELAAVAAEPLRTDRARAVILTVRSVVGRLGALLDPAVKEPGHADD